MPVVESCISLANRVWVAPNEFNHCLDEERALWLEIVRRGGLEYMCPSLVAKRYMRPPWEKMPPEGRRMREFGSIALPLVEQVDTSVLLFRMPIGWDGVAENVSFTYTGSGFEEGSGDIHFRLRAGARYIPNFDDVLTQLNDLRFGYTDAGAFIRLLSLQFVQAFVFLGAGALGRLVGGRINCTVTGWVYPKR